MYFFSFQFEQNAQKKRTMMELKKKQILLFFFFSSCCLIYVLLPFGLISFTLRPGGNDCFTFSAFSLSGTITKQQKKE
jgi:hypothetical protein